MSTTPRPSSGGRPPGWQQEHARRYLETGGQDGHIWEGVTTLLLTTTGRRSGQPRTTPLIYGRDGERYLVVASRGGARGAPGVVREPRRAARRAGAGDGGPLQGARPHRLPAERAALWKTMAAIWPPYDEYQARTTREIPVVIIERA